MMKKNSFEETVIVEQIDDIRCDICNKSILAKAEDDDLVSYGSLLCSTDLAENIRAGETANMFHRESTDLCKGCYDGIMEEIRKRGGKAPSYYFSGLDVDFSDLEEWDPHGN